MWCVSRRKDVSSIRSSQLRGRGMSTSTISRTLLGLRVSTMIRLERRIAPSWSRRVSPARDSCRRRGPEETSQ